MSDLPDQFKRFRDEHARLHDPALLRGAVELVPVELSEVASQLAGIRKKRKKRHGMAAAWAPAPAVTLPGVEPAESERLLPPAFIQQLRAQPPRKTPRSESAAKNSQGKPRIEIEPQHVRRQLSLFQELAFMVDAPGARQVELVWSKPLAASEEIIPADAARSNTLSDNSLPDELQRVVMDHQAGDRFEGQIGLPDDKYLIAFAVDGRMRPPQDLAQRVVVNRKGLFAPLELRRQQQTFVLTNSGATDERVSLQTEAPWLMPERALIDLPAGESAQASVRFDLSRMKPGLNEALLHLQVRREEETIAAGVVQVAVELEVGGAVGDFTFTPRAFGEVRQGLDDLQLEVAVKARGLGPLNGMISLPQSGELVDFRLNADDQAASHFAHTFHINSAHLALPQPHTDAAALKLMILTDSFLANHRLCRFEIPYRLVYLKKSLPALSFGTIRTGGTKTMRLQVERSDAREIELAIALPEATERFLEAYPARADVYVFRFNASHLPPGTKVDETIELIDRKSGLRDHIKILAAIAHPVEEPAYTVAKLATS